MMCFQSIYLELRDMVVERRDYIIVENTRKRHPKDNLNNPACLESRVGRCRDDVQKMLHNIAKNTY